MKIAAIAVSLLFAIFASLQSRAATTVYTVSLSGPAESPPNASPGTGTGTITLDSTAGTMAVDMLFSGLIGLSTAAHIHCCTAAVGTGTAGVATTFPGFPIGVTAGQYVNTFIMLDGSSYNSSFVTANGGSVAAAYSALTTGMAQGRAYFNIHTNLYAAGEIRGFLLIPGTCGSANGVVANAAPTANLCSAGSATAVTTAASFTWTCSGTACSAPFARLNVDSSDAASVYAAGTDGVMLLRYLFGLRGAALTQSGALLGTNAQRDAAQIETHIATNLAFFDVDGDSKTLALTDGLMILRRMLGLSGTALTASAKQTSRTDAAVAAAIDALRP